MYNSNWFYTGFCHKSRFYHIRLLAVPGENPGISGTEFFYGPDVPPVNQTDIVKALKERERTSTKQWPGLICSLSTIRLLINKLALYGTDGRLFTTDGPCHLQSHVTQKLGHISKIRPNQI